MFDLLTAESLHFLPGTVCRWDADNNLYWVVSGQDRPVAVITVDLDSAEYPVYYLIRVYPEWSVIDSRTVYHFGGIVYTGQDWIKCQRWALELI